VNCQTERNAEIKYDKDTCKIKNKFICKGKPTVFGTAFDREPGFKTENLIKYQIQ